MLHDFGYSGAYGKSESKFKSLSLDDLRKKVPSAFAEKPSSVVSENYIFMPSFPLVEHMLEQGFVATNAFESRTSNAEKKGHTKHSIRFVNRDLRVPNVGETYESRTFTNSHDGTSSFQFRGGVEVVACLNGLIRLLSQEDIVRITHSSKALDKLKLAMPKLLAATAELRNDIADFAIIQLKPEEQRAFAKAAAELRWRPEESETDPGVIISTVPIAVEKLLVPRRHSDSEIKNSLWGTLNIVQEHIIKGEDRGLAQTGRRMTIRPVTSVDNDIAINVGLWNLAAGMREALAS
jgi:hypothetical protein